MLLAKVKALIGLLMALLVAGCNDLAIFDNYSAAPTLSQLSAIRLDANGYLELAWAEKGKIPNGNFAVYLKAIDQRDSHFSFSEKARYNSPLTSEIIEVASELAPHKSGILVPTEGNRVIVLKSLMKTGQSYLLELYSAKETQTEKIKVLLLKVDFGSIEGAYAEVRSEFVHVQWKAVPGANRYEVYADDSLTLLLGSSTETYLNLPISNETVFKKYFVRSLRGQLSAKGYVEVELIRSSEKITRIRPKSPPGIYREGQFLDLEVSFSSLVTLYGESSLPLTLGNLTRDAAYLQGSGSDTFLYRYAIEPGADAEILSHGESLKGSLVDVLGLSITGQLSGLNAEDQLKDSTTITIDTLAPIAPASVGFAQAVTTQAQVPVSFVLSTDKHFATHRAKLCTVNDCATGCSVEVESLVSPVLTSGTPGYSYYACVQGVDRVGHTSSWVNSVRAIVIDQIAPTVARVYSSASDGTYGTGSSIAVVVEFTEAVFVQNPTEITLKLETGSNDRILSYSSGSGTNSLVFQYTVQAGESNLDLNYFDVAALSKGSSGILSDAAGNGANLNLPNLNDSQSLAGQSAVVIDAVSPTITDVTSGNANGKYGAGTSISVSFTLSRAVTVTGGTPRVLLNTTPAVYATYVGGSGTSILNFAYTVAPGELSADLNYASTTAFDANGALLKDSLNNILLSTLPSLTDPHSLGTQKAIQIDGDNQSPDLASTPSTQEAFNQLAISPIDASTTGTGLDIDADGETLTYTCFYDNTANGAMDAGGTACASLPQTSFSFSTVTGILNWTPSASASSNDTVPTTYEFAFTGTDAANFMDTTYAVVKVLKTFQTTITYPAGSSGSYAISDSNQLDFSGNFVRLKAVDQKDDDLSATGFTVANAGGAAWDSGTSTMRLGTSGFCTGSGANCAAQYNFVSYATSGVTPILYHPFAGDAPFTPNATGAVPTYGLGNARVFYIGTSFNGTTKYLAKTRDFADTFSISVWVNSSQSYSSNACTLWSDGVGLVSANASGDLNDFGIFLCDGFIQAGVGNPDTTLRSLARVNNGTWHHVVFTRNKVGGAIQLFVDGILHASASGNSNSLNASTELFLATDNAASATRFSGVLDELIIQPVILSPLEIRNIYERQRVNHTGIFSSRSIDAAVSSPWTGIQWKTPIPYGKELPDYASGAIQNETTASYSALSSNTLMNNIAGLWHLNESTADTLPGNKDFKDTSGQDNHGEVLNTVTLGAHGRLNKGAQFTGAGEVKLANPSSFAFGTGSFTLSAWVRFGIDALPRMRIINSGFSGTANGVSLEVDPSGTRLGVGIGCAGGAVANCVYVRIGASFNDNYWHQVIVTVDGTAKTLRMFVDGTQRNLTKEATIGSCGTISGSNVLDITACTNLNASGGGDVFFGSDGSSNRFIGALDEIAVWTKSFTAAEVADLFARGGQRLLIQVRSCAQANCSDSIFKGPDGTNQTFFTELNNNSNPNTGDGIVKPTALTINFADYPGLTIANNRYFQYTVIMEDDSSVTPIISSVEALPGRYYLSKPSIVYQTPINHRTLGGITEVLGAGGCIGGLSYQLSKDNSAWYYYNGSAWAAAGTTSQSNSAAVVASEAQSLATLLGRPSDLYVKTIFNTSGPDACELDDLTIRSNEFH